MFQKSYISNINKLYLVPTPIGNIEDITIRSLNILRNVDLILCEDTRVTSNLLNKYEIKKQLLSCHKYNEKSMINKIKELLDNGKNIALVTDQGTPLISDPGFLVVFELTKLGYDVVCLPGATAFVPALAVSGIDSTKFLFYGFLNSKETKRKRELESIKMYRETIILYEAPHRLIQTLKNILEIFGNRKISISREISKYYEEIYRGNVEHALENFKILKGEIVIVIEGAKDVEDFSSLTILEHIKLYLDEGISENEAIKKVAKERKITKSIIYKEYHTRK